MRPTQSRPTRLHHNVACYVVVGLKKPAYTRESAFTDKTGGCNSEVDVVERMDA